MTVKVQTIGVISKEVVEAVVAAIIITRITMNVEVVAAIIIIRIAMTVEATTIVKVIRDSVKTTIKAVITITATITKEAKIGQTVETKADVINMTISSLIPQELLQCNSSMVAIKETLVITNNISSNTQLLNMVNTVTINSPITTLNNIIVRQPHSTMVSMSSSKSRLTAL